MTAPNANAPKIGCTPIHAVAYDDRKMPLATRTSPKAANVPPWMRSSANRSNGRTTTTIATTYATDQPMTAAKSPGPLAVTMVTTRASRHQAITSPVAALASTSDPTRLRESRLSTRMRASTGNAVMDMLVAT